MDAPLVIRPAARPDVETLTDLAMNSKTSHAHDEAFVALCRRPSNSRKRVEECPRALLLVRKAMAIELRFASPGSTPARICFRNSAVHTAATNKSNQNGHSLGRSSSHQSTNYLDL